MMGALQIVPEAALLGFTLGVLLIYLELNRPGLILPGAAGLLLVLLSTASLVEQDRVGVITLRGGGLALIGTAAVLLLLDLLRRTPVVVPLAATLALCLGFAHVVATSHGATPPPASPSRVPALVAILCGLVLGLTTAALTRIARRARVNKAVD